MKKRIISVIFGILFVISLMFAEYRFIMKSIKPYTGSNGTVYIELFGNVESYSAEQYLVKIKDINDK